MKVLLLLLVVTLACGCSPPPDYSNRVALAELQNAVKVQQGEIVKLQNSIVFLLQNEKNKITDKSEVLTIDPTSNGFQIQATRFGPVLIKPVSASPYLDGYKIILSIGNLTSATFARSSAEVAWLDSSLNFKPDLATNSAKLPNQKTIQINTPISAGSWTPVEIIIAPATAEAVHQLGFSITPETIQMRYQ